VSDWRSLIESETYTEQLSKIGNVERLDEALSGIYWGIAKQPSDFPIIGGAVRLAKIRTLETPNGAVDIRIWFTEISRKEVELLAIHAQKAT
jgi:hypothetical protein